MAASTECGEFFGYNDFQKEMENIFEDVSNLSMALKEVEIALINNKEQEPITDWDISDEHLGNMLKYSFYATLSYQSRSYLYIFLTTLYVSQIRKEIIAQIDGNNDIDENKKNKMKQSFKNTSFVEDILYYSLYNKKSIKETVDRCISGTCTTDQIKLARLIMPTADRKMVITVSLISAIALGGFFGTLSYGNTLIDIRKMIEKVSETYKSISGEIKEYVGQIKPYTSAYKKYKSIQKNIPVASRTLSGESVDANKKRISRLLKKSFKINNVNELISNISLFYFTRHIIGFDLLDYIKENGYDMPNFDKIIFSLCKIGNIDESIVSPISCTYSSDIQCPSKYWFFYDKSAHSIIISFRGTMENIDWLANVNALTPEIVDVKWNPTQKIVKEVGNIELHSGFYLYANFIFQKYNKYLYDMLAKDDKLKLYLVGHSLGAAMANVFYILFWHYVSDEDRLINVNIVRDRVFVYGYATPPYASKQSVKNIKSDLNRFAFTKNIFNIIDINDVVPFATIKDYDILGTVFEMDSTKNIINTFSYNSTHDIHNLRKYAGEGKIFDVMNIYRYHTMTNYINSIIRLIQKHPSITPDKLLSDENIKLFCESDEANKEQCDPTKITKLRNQITNDVEYLKQTGLRSKKYLSKLGDNAINLIKNLKCNFDFSTISNLFSNYSDADEDITKIEIQNFMENIDEFIGSI